MNRIGEALCAALQEGSSGTARSVLATLTPAEWHDVATLAIRQRVGPLLFSRPGLPMPDEVRALLRARAEVSARRALMHQAAFRELAGAVAPLGMSLMALKGLHLATSVYPSTALREMNDIDVMVKAADVAAVSAIVRGLGYAPTADIPVSTALNALHHVPRFLRRSVGLEVHWRIAPPGTVPRADPDELWAMKAPSSMASNAWVLPAEALLVHICAHAGSHRFEQGVRPLCDVQAIISRSAGLLSWPLVLDLARRWDCERSVALVLSLAHGDLGADVPDEVLQALGDHRPTAEICSLAMTQALGDSGLIARTSTDAGALLATPGLWAKLRYLGERIWLPGPVMATLYPDAGTGRLARPIATLRRVADLLRRYPMDLLRLATHRDRSARNALDRRNALIAWLSDR